jgi:hypothetical protein
MATQTPVQRQAAAKRAAATRKQNAAKRSASATKSSARRTRTAASGTTRRAQSTARTAGTTTAQAADSAAKTLEATGMQLGAVARNAQRAVLIPVGAFATAGDAIQRIAVTYASSATRARQLDRFERRGARALGRRLGKVASRSR